MNTISNDIQIAIRFNQQLKKLVDMGLELKSDTTKKATFMRFRSKLNDLMRKQDDYVIRMIGPYLWNNRVEIQNANVDYFLTKSYEGSLMELSMEYGFDYDDSLILVKHIIKGYAKSQARKRDMFTNGVIELLKIYVEYTLETKKDP